MGEQRNSDMLFHCIFPNRFVRTEQIGLRSASVRSTMFKKWKWFKTKENISVKPSKQLEVKCISLETTGENRLRNVQISGYRALTDAQCFQKCS